MTEREGEAMMTDQESMVSEPMPPDPRATALLREVAAAPAPSAALRARIVARGALRLRRQGAWWSYAAGWARAAVPLALAAGLAAMIALGARGEAAALGMRPVQVVASGHVDTGELLGVAAGAGGAGGTELLDHVALPVTDAAVLAAVEEQ